MGLGCTRKELLARIDADELCDWQALWNIDPWGEQRADLRAGRIAQILANANRGPHTSAYPLERFLPYADERPRPSRGELRRRVRRRMLGRD